MNVWCHSLIGLESWDTCSSRRSAVESTIAYLSDRGIQGDEPVCSTSIFKPGIVAGLEYGGQGMLFSK